MRKIFLGLSLVYGLVGCVSKTVETGGDARFPAGVGDVGSSTDGSESFVGRYKLPMVRNGEKKIRLAYNYWSGEWPRPVIDVNSKVKGKTTIQGYVSPRELTERKSCTIKNALYHPWAYDAANSSILEFYSFVSTTDLVALKDLKSEKVKIPKGAHVVDVVYLSEGYASATLMLGKQAIHFDTTVGFLYSTSNFKQLNSADDFNEQWIYLQCAEDDAGKPRKIFVRDSDLLSQPGVTEGTFAEYGKVKAQ